MAVEGSWQLTKGVFERLNRDGVEDAIKQKYWSSQINDPSNFRAIWKDRARPGCQMPYAVYSVVSDTRTENSTGTGKEQTLRNRDVSPSNQGIQYRLALIQFECYAKTDGNSDESWSIDIASMIVDSLENGRLELCEGTRFISMIREGDIEMRDDDDNSLIVVRWQVDYELLIDMGRLLA